ncbi:hypothetical protein UF75_0857 [Desulfosporosinus sp. I2]|nr:hypothetical protein UF75_0857 [Desulfosporosinus sp. I2]
MSMGILFTSKEIEPTLRKKTIIYNRLWSLKELFISIMLLIG